MAREWAAKLEEVKEAVKEAETSVRALEAEKEKVEKETATEAATIEAKKREKAENDALFASGKATVGEPRVLDCGKYAGMTTMEARKAIVKERFGSTLLAAGSP